MSSDEFLYEHDLISISSLISARLKYLGIDPDGNDIQQEEGVINVGEVRGVDFL